jgi:hypothetical protein
MIRIKHIKEKFVTFIKSEYSENIMYEVHVNPKSQELKEINKLTHPQNAFRGLLYKNGDLYVFSMNLLHRYVLDELDQTVFHTNGAIYNDYRYYSYQQIAPLEIYSKYNVYPIMLNEKYIDNYKRMVKLAQPKNEFFNFEIGLNSDKPHD